MLHVAADAVMKFYRRGRMVDGRLAPGTIELQVDRWVHGYRSKSARTLCGLTVANLHWLPFQALEFAAVDQYLRCPRCASRT